MSYIIGSQIEKHLQIMSPYKFMSKTHSYQLRTSMEIPEWFLWIPIAIWMAFLWIPGGIPGKFYGNSTQITEWFQMEFDGIPMTSKFNYCKNRVQHQCILNTYLSRIHIGWVEELQVDEGLHLCSEIY